MARQPAVIRATFTLLRAALQVVRAAMLLSPLVQVAVATAARQRLPRVQLFRRVPLVAASALLVVLAAVVEAYSSSVAMAHQVALET